MRKTQRVNWEEGIEAEKFQTAILIVNKIQMKTALRMKTIHQNFLG